MPEENPVKTYLVGGALRDRLLGRAGSDHDWVVVGATPEQMFAQGYRAVGTGFPVFIHPQSGEEYALARSERKTGRGYKGFEFFTSPDISIEEDLLRRDLTVNAIAEDDKGTLIDPFGGLEDIGKRTLRHVSPAFVEDPLRVLRVARFAAQLADYGFSVHESTRQLMIALVQSGELRDLTPERIWIETQKALQSARPRLYFEILREVGALAQLFPEIDRLFGVPQPPQHHPEVDTGLHILLCLDRICELTDDPRLRFATLLHDLGKGTTKSEFWPSHHEHEERGVPLVNDFCERLRVPNSWRELAARVSRWHLHAHRCQQLRPTTIEKLFSGLDLWRQPNNLRDFMLCCCADARGRTGFEQVEYAAINYLPPLYEAAAKVEIQPLLDAGLKGADIGKAVRIARLKAIKAAIDASL